MKNKIKLHHGSNTIVRVPDLSMSRDDIDFGKGFYLTEDFVMAAKWACRKAVSICNEYELLLEGLKVYEFSLNEEWLQFVVENRELENVSNKYAEYDVLIGATADDKLFDTIELYEDGFISAETAIETMNCMDYGKQYVLKSEKAVQNLKCIGHVRVQGEEKEKYRKSYREDRIKANVRTEQILRKRNRGRGR